MEIKALGKKYKIKEITYKERRELHRLNAKAFWDGKINPDNYYDVLEKTAEISGLGEKDFKGLTMIEIDQVLQQIFTQYMGLEKKRRWGLSFYVWISYYKLQSVEQFKKLPYVAQSPLSLDYINFKDEADIWKEVEAISELAKTSQNRTMGQFMYDLIPLFASPLFFEKQWMVEIMNEYHWIKNWNVSPGNLDDISAFRLDCWTIIENEINQINKHESKNGK